MADQNIKISPERQQAFIEFVRSLPRTCSPSIFIPGKTTNSFDSTQPFKSKNSLLDCSELPPNTPDASDQQSFNWSIEEYAMVYGQDFSNEHELEHFHSLIHSDEGLSKELDSENERYFSQEKILPSPQFSSTTNQCPNEQESNLFSSSNGSRSTGSFLRILDNLAMKSIDNKTSSCSPPSLTTNEFDNLDVSMKSPLPATNFNNEQTSAFVSMLNGDEVDGPEEENKRELSIIQSSSSSAQRKLSFMDISSHQSPGLLALRNDRFLENISPIVANHGSNGSTRYHQPQPQIKTTNTPLVCRSFLTYSNKKTTLIVDEENKENEFHRFIDSGFDNNGHNGQQQNNSIESSTTTESYVMSTVKQRTPSRVILHEQNIKHNKSIEFQTPSSSLSNYYYQQQRSTRILRPKLLFHNINNQNHSKSNTNNCELTSTPTISRAGGGSLDTF